ncbi:hypothetical protein, conserved [Plasmodium gonderi]|uniref:Secreted ookinete protein n=1 Tax=Plasmodium gonderi TaxID=77519 RepID=A0A1Y1JA31_PLAGO|nr:hypothetical protein, conserved [Plasmodium gonderi]GAW79356.1 hypothetical protein, conserved [Plasmodium gonderi]
MKKLLTLTLFFFAITLVRSHDEGNVSISKTLNDHFKKKNSANNGKAFNLEENIKYKRKNNYELFVNSNGELKQERYGVTEPRQMLKKNISHLRYLINDLEILTGVYKFNGRDKEKVLKETLKPESLCFTLLGLLSNNINNLLTVEDSPIYGFLIKGEKIPYTNQVKNLLEIYVIMSNISVYLGDFYFPTSKNAPYEIPFLFGYYDNKINGSVNKTSFNYLCPLPTFLIDVIRTTKFGMKFNFNGSDLDAKELYPATLSYWIETPNMLPIQKGDKYKNSRMQMIDLLKKEAKDVSYRKVHDTGLIDGVGIQQAYDRIKASLSFSNALETIKKFLSTSGKTSMDSSSSSNYSEAPTALYFLLLSQKLFTKVKKQEPKSVITKVDISNVKENASGYLQAYTIKLTLEDSTCITTDAVVQGKNILMPQNIKLKSALKGGEKGTSTSTSTVSLDVPFNYGLQVGGNDGLTYSFAGFSFSMSKTLPYSINSLTPFVHAQSDM